MLAAACSPVLRTLKTQPWGAQWQGEEEVKIWVTLAVHNPKALQKLRDGVLSLSKPLPAPGLGCGHPPVSVDRYELAGSCFHLP